LLNKTPVGPITLPEYTLLAHGPPHFCDGFPLHGSEQLLSLNSPYLV